MRIKNLYLFMFMMIMGMAFASCGHDDEEIPCKDCENVAVAINVVNIDGQPMTRGIGYTTWGAGTYDTTETPEIGAKANSGYTITGFVCDTQFGGRTLNWSGSATQKTDKANGANGNHTYTVTVEEEQKFTNTVKASAGGSASGSYTGITGSTHPIIATANNGYKFKNWTCTGGATVANSTSASTTGIIGGSNGTITGNFTRNEPVKYTVSVSESTGSYGYSGPYCSVMAKVNGSWRDMSVLNPSRPSGSFSVEAGTEVSVSLYGENSAPKLISFTVNGRDYSRERSWSGTIWSSTDIQIVWSSNR